MAADEHGQQVGWMMPSWSSCGTVLADMTPDQPQHAYGEHEEEIITTDEDGNESDGMGDYVRNGVGNQVSHKTTAEMAATYGFTVRQNEQLALLSDPQYDAL